MKRMRIKWWRAFPLDIGTIVIDTDGVLTDGKIYLTDTGDKMFKRFGPDDHDAIIAARNAGIRVIIVSADRSGLAISEARAKHMHSEFAYVPSLDRAGHLVRDHDVYLDDALYIGDGFHDNVTMQLFAVSAAPADACASARRAADIVSSRAGGDRAVAEIISYVLKRKGKK